jgi:hypothetical protein
VALFIAGMWALSLIAAGFVVPMYRTAGAGTAGGASSGRVSYGTDTLVGVNGPGVLVVLAVPLVVTLLVGCALLLRARSAALPIAWTLTGLLAVFNLLALASIGLLIIPVTVCLVVACATSRGRLSR